jgi:hypothetical protein
MIIAGINTNATNGSVNKRRNRSFARDGVGDADHGADAEDEAEEVSLGVCFSLKEIYGS